MVLLLAAHLTQVSLFGAYKKPREVTWWLGLCLFACTLGFALTGYLLPWDQKGYWATRVATNIAGTIPVVGDAQQRLLVGGAEYGNLTLTRFYAIHVFILPASVALLATAHVALFRKHGVTPSVKADLSKVDAFHPSQLAKDVLASLFVLGLVFAFALREHGAPLDAPADPASDYPARPEWYFLGLFQLLKYFHGPLEIVGTVVLPALVGLYLFALPLLDRAPTTALRSRVKALVPLGLIALGAVLLTAQAMREDARDARFQKERVKADERAAAANRIALGGVPPEGPLAMLARAPEVRGPELFDKNCAGCHVLGTLGSEKDRTAPKLDGWGTEAWIMSMIHDPDGDLRFGRTPYKGEMPSVDMKPKDAPDSWKPMPEEEKRAVAQFLAQEGADSASDSPGAKGNELGRKIVTTRCTACHTYKGEGDEAGTGLAPELAGYASVSWIKAQITNPSTNVTYRENALSPERKGHMPRFDSEMKVEDIELLARWVHAQARGSALR
jgi:ubiquinol-cytochrome c reductase cytochrome b subunit